MYRIREIKFSPNSVSIQVYKIENRKRKIIRHIGTAKNEIEKANLIQLARDFIKIKSKQLTLFEEKYSDSILNLSQCEYVLTSDAPSIFTF